MNLSDPPVVEDGEEEEWFGEGSAFDSGEELAAALFAMAGPAPVAASAAPAPPGSFDEVIRDEPAPPPVDDGFVLRSGPAVVRIPAVAPLEEFHLLGDPRPPAKEADVQVFIRQVGDADKPAPHSWAVRAGGAAPTRRVGRGWSMRNSVHVLKTTEDVIRRLREDAVAITWNAARVAVTHSDDKLCKQISLN